MKNINKVRTANSKLLQFKNEADMWKMLFEIKEFLVPYSEETISTYKKYDDVVYWMRRGIRTGYWNNGEDKVYADILIRAEDFKKIEHLFKKESFRRGKSVWILK